MLTESWCPMGFAAAWEAAGKYSETWAEEQPYLAKVLEVPPQSVLVHARSQASHKDFLGALGIGTV